VDAVSQEVVSSKTAGAIVGVSGKGTNLNLSEGIASVVSQSPVAGGEDSRSFSISATSNDSPLVASQTGSKEDRAKKSQVRGAELKM